MGLIKARDALLNQLKVCGINVIFGNPGSTEENFLEAVNEHCEIKYVLGLQEASVAAMADGWARSTRKPAVCQIHSAVGLGNAMGVLYQAHRSHTPMVVFAGEPPTELQTFDGFLAGDLSRIAMPLTKWSARITHGSQLVRMLRRAISALAEGFGMKGIQVKNADSLRTALRNALEYDGPTLIDALVNGSVEQEIHQLFPDVH